MVLRAGIGVATITPDLPVRLAGYGDRRGVAMQVHDDLEVRAVVLDDGLTRACLCTFDLLGMTRDVSSVIRDSIARDLDVEPAAVLTACTHVHAGPSALAGTDAIGWPVPPALSDLLVARARGAVADAVVRAEPVHASFARGALPGDVAVNRRGHPLEPSAAVLELRGATTVVWIANFGIHPTITGPANLAVTTDWVGPFRRALEAHGGRALFLQGCQGDVNPAVTAWEDGDPQAWAPVVDDYAARLATAVAAIAARVLPSGDRLHVAPGRRVAVTIGDTRLAQLAGSRTQRSVELLVWSIGDVAVVSVPGEAFHAVEHEVRVARGEALLLAGLAPDWHGYLPRPYTEGYEEGLSLGRDAVEALVRELVGFQQTPSRT